MKILMLTIALILSMTSLAVADTSLVLSRVSADGVSNTITGIELSKVSKDNTAVTFGYAKSLSMLNQDEDLSRISAELGKQMQLDGPLAFASIGLGVGLYRVDDGNSMSTDVGAYLLAKVDLLPQYDTFLQAKYTSVLNGNAGDGWSVGIGRSF